MYDPDVPYLLPEAYARMVTDAGIVKINTGRIKFNLIRKIKNAGTPIPL